jgi:ABC-type glycerol-3-phosphate transport system permease component
LLWTGIDAYRIDYQPIRDNNPAAFFFFLTSIILFSLFFLNLFVGVVIDTFKREKDILSRNNELNSEQREWISIYTMILSSSPQLKFKNTGNYVVDKCRYISQHKYFEYFILSCIILNTFVLTLSWYGQSEEVA